MPPTSLYLETGRWFDLDAVIDALSRALDEFYAVWTDMGNIPIIEAWKQHAPMLGRPVEAAREDGPFRGIAEDVGADGCLLIRTEAGELQRLYAGDVTMQTEDT